MDESDLSGRIIGAAIDVHRELGPGLLESAYEECLVHELLQQGMECERQKPVPVVYKGVRVDCGFRVDILVACCVVVEVKAVSSLVSIHEAQLLTYLRLTGCRLGLLINFNVRMLRDGIRRRML